MTMTHFCAGECGVALDWQRDHDLAVERAKKAEADSAEQRRWKETAYSERAKLLSMISRLFPAFLASHDLDDTSWDPAWRTIVFVELPTGQASWHIHDSDLPLFEHLTVYPNRWDGHTTEEKYERVLAVRPNLLDRFRFDLANQDVQARERIAELEAEVAYLRAGPDDCDTDPASAVFEHLARPMPKGWKPRPEEKQG